jgi:peptidoglycan hydrolase-like protein with peptidoglycan-binding domain
MRISKNTLMTASLMFCLVGIATASSRKYPTKSHTHASLRHSSGRRHAATRHETVAVVMPSERATQIQAALIKQGYLSGEPTGTWDAHTIAAMQKMQADNGWQSKVTPDSRALIKLGLGPQTAESSVSQTSVNQMSASQTSMTQTNMAAQTSPQ